MNTNRPEPATPRKADGPWEITFEVPPGMVRVIQQLAADSGQPIEGVFNRAIALYRASLDAVHEGKHVGVAERSDALETEFVGLVSSGSQ